MRGGGNRQTSWGPSSRNLVPVRIEPGLPTGPFPTAVYIPALTPRLAHLVLLPAPLLIVVEDVVPEVVLQPVQKSLVPRLPAEPCQEGHEQGEQHQQQPAGQHDEEGFEAEPRAPRPQRGGPWQTGTIPVAAAHGHVQGLLVLQGWLPRVPE